MNPPRSASLPILAAIAVWVLAIGGCATPVEVKTASKRQLELIDALDQATRDLEAALADFHRGNQSLIRNQARVGIARQSIDVAMEGEGDEKKVTADALFEIHKSEVRPWIDAAFEDAAIARRIAQLEKAKAKATSPVDTFRIENELNELEIQKAALASKPSAVAELESIYAGELEAEQEAIAALAARFAILRAQIAAMKAAQIKVDSWLSIDVTVSQEQVDALTETFRSAHQKLTEAP